MPNKATPPPAKTLVPATSLQPTRQAQYHDEIARIIKTPQELVHIRHTITLSQYKLWLLMLRAFRMEYEVSGEELQPETMCYVSLKELEAYFGYELKLSQLRDDLEAIRKEPILINLLTKDGKESQVGQGFIFMYEVSASRVGVVLPPLIRHAVCNLGTSSSIFHNLNWSIFNSMAGKYDAIIYKLCKDYIGVGRTPYMPLEVFRSYIGLEATEYTAFKQLSQSVIRRSLDRINTNPITDIEVACKYKKQGRTVVGLQFELTPKYQAGIDFGDHASFVYARVTIPQAKQQAYVKEFGAAAVEMSIRRANEYADEQRRLGKDVKYGALYRKAIEDNWGAELLRHQELEAIEEKSHQDAKRKEQNQRRQERLQELKREYQSLRREATIAALTLEELEKLAKRFQETKGLDAGAVYEPSAGTYSPKHTNNMFRIWIKSEVKVPFQVEEFGAWLQQEKGVDISDIDLSAI